MAYRRRAVNNNDVVGNPEVGEKAPDFMIQLSTGEATLHELAARHKRLAVTSQDSYRYHRN